MTNMLASMRNCIALYHITSCSDEFGVCILSSYGTAQKLF